MPFLTSPLNNNLLFLLLLLLTTSSLTTTTQAFKLPPSTFLTTRCSDSPTLGTPTYGNQSIIFTTCAEREIHAPTQEIYKTLLTFSEYKNWNSFVIEVRDRKGNVPPPAAGVKGVGFEMVFTTQGLFPLGVKSFSKEVVSFTEREVGFEGGKKGRVNGWKFGEILGLRAEHVNVLVELEGGISRYVSWESYYGLIAPLAGVLLEKNLKEGFERQADDLKRLVEG